MRVDLYGLAFETPRVTVHLWSPWRTSALEHRLFEVIKGLPRVEFEQGPDEWRLIVADPKSWRAAVQAVARVLKGWQEEADPGSERRNWRWLVEGDTDAHGYEQTGDPASIWLLIRLSLERGTPGEPEKGEDIDLEGFTVRLAANEVT
ncbi:MAG: hypothetical protein ACHRHE_24240 [Tepidisphaerales bacterium]